MNEEIENSIVVKIEEENPVSQIAEKELDDIILKMGSLLSIINNKKINQAKLLITLLTNRTFQKCFFMLYNLRLLN